jgi:hypothetical protein
LRKTSSKKFKSLFVFGFISDNDKGGFVVSEVYNNLNIVLKEKQDKIAPYFSKYQEWWLILIDHVSYGLTNYDFNQLKSLPKIESSFYKTVILSPSYEKDKLAFIIE